MWPGWDAVPFLTADFVTVLWLIDVSLVATIAVNLIYVVRDPRWLTAAGAVVTTAFGLAAAVRILQVFPFDFGASDFWPWSSGAALGRRHRCRHRHHRERGDRRPESRRRLIGVRSGGGPGRPAPR